MNRVLCRTGSSQNILLLTVLLLVSSGCSRMFLSSDPVAHRQAAEQSLAAALGIAQAGGRRDDVIAQLRETVSLDPNWAVGRAAYGNALYAMGHLDEALVQFIWAVKMAPENAEYKHAVGVIKLRQEKAVEGLGFLIEANGLVPTNRIYRDTLLNAYVQIGRWDRAISLWDAGAMRDAPDSERSAIEVILLAVQDRYDEAVKVAKEASLLNPKDSLFPFLEGLLWEGLGHADKAIRSYERAAGMNARSYELRRLLTELYLRNGYYRKAEQTIRTYLVRKSKSMDLPEKVRSYYELADAQYQTANYRVSRRSYAQYRKLLQLLAQRSGRKLPVKTVGVDAVAHFANGVIEEKKEQYPQAITEYLLAIRGDLQFVMAYERLGQSYLLLAELSALTERPPLLRKAKEVLEQAINIQRNLPDAYMLLGNATFQLAQLSEEKFRKGLLREALFLFGQADAGAHDKYAIRVFQGKISDNLEEHGQALKYYTEALKYRPEDSTVQALIGHSLLKMKRFEAAIEAFNKARGMGADRFDTAAGLALANERLRRFDEADKYYLEVRSAVQAAPSSRAGTGAKAAPAKASPAVLPE